MKLIASMAMAASILAAQSARPELNRVTAVRHWSLAEATRIAIEVSGDFDIRSDRLHNPERIYYDILNARPYIQGKRSFSQPVNDPRVSRVRVAETLPGVTRVVIDLVLPVEVATSQLTNPDRLMIELRPAAAPATPPETALQPAVSPSATPPPVQALTAEPSKVQVAKGATPESILAAARTPAPTAVTAPAPAPPKPIPPVESMKPAKPASAGSASLVRALGLKVGRVVIDPGHGGHDQGSKGPKGLLEKDLVLDVSLRLGKLVEDKLGAEVVYTRSDDTFIPLEGRTALANEKKADLFLSVHANSASTSRISGVETYYLNFTDSKDALDVAARENASSEKSIFELQDLVKTITLHDKAAESKEFAARMQAAMYQFSARNVAGTRNRGVRKAPFVVLIGARMPSVLAEIGFISNPREEALLKKADYRQKLAEALFRGLQKYAQSLSHFQVAQAQE